MAQATTPTSELIGLAEIRHRPPPNPVSSVLRFIRRYPLGAVGGALILLLVVVAAFAPLIATQDQYALSARNRLKSPSNAHYFGTDELGRDIFSRVVYGARISLQVGFIAVGVGV